MNGFQRVILGRGLHGESHFSPDSWEHSSNTGIYSLLEDQRVIGSSGMTRLKTASQLAFLNRGGNDANIVSSSLLMEHALIGVA
jgi:hypothetical protein